MPYLHGAYSNIGDSVTQSVAQSDIVSVYFGCAPVHLVRSAKGVVSKPVKLSNWSQALRLMGYSEDWSKYSLCEPMCAHFNNPNGNVGPIYVVNVLDPAIHCSDEETSATLTFSNRQAIVKSSDIVLDTFAVADKVEGKDYSVDYDYTKGQLVVTDIGETPIEGTVNVSYKVIDLSKVTEDDLVGGVSANGKVAGISALKLLYQTYNAIPFFIAAPGWSHKPKVYNALMSMTSKVNGHWDTFVMADLPVRDSEHADMDDMTKVKEWREDNGYSGERSKVCWPMGRDALGRKYHLSTENIVEAMRLGSLPDNASVPFNTPSNQAIPLTGMCFGEDSTMEDFDEEAANDLNSVGISTMKYWEGSWRLWGGHTAAYRYGIEQDARCIFDTNLWVLMYLTNRFQRVWALKVDKPMTNALKDRIVVEENSHLKYLVNLGALIGSPTMSFNQVDNPVSNMINGDFEFRHLVTPTPQAKSLTAGVSFTDAGYSSYFGSSSDDEGAV